MNSKHVNAENVEVIAKMIARCDFRVTISRYVTGDACPWVITVGESNWKRNIVVEQTNVDGTEAMVGILEGDETHKVANRLMLSELVSERYVGVKKTLKEEPVPA